MNLRLIILIVALCVTSITFSQVKEGRVIYRASTNNKKFIEKLNENKTIDKNIKKSILYNLENAKDIQFNLDFNDHESLFYHLEKKALENEGERRGGHTGIIAGAKNIYYTNLDNKEIFKQNEYFNKLLVLQEPTVWNMTQESKTIGEYICFKAETTIKVDTRNGIITKSIIAWYTPQIPVSFGVQSFSGLSGLTLELKIDDTLTFKAIKIELNPTQKLEIERPKGKKVSSEEYNNMIKETLGR